MRLVFLVSKVTTVSGVGLTECLIRSVIFTNLHVVSVNADVVFLGVAMSNKKNKANY